MESILYVGYPDSLSYKVLEGCRAQADRENDATRTLRP
jgi:hypothetical protein